MSDVQFAEISIKQSLTPGALASRVLSGLPLTEVRRVLDKKIREIKICEHPFCNRRFLRTQGSKRKVCFGHEA